MAGAYAAASVDSVPAAAATTGDNTEYLTMFLTPTATQTAEAAQAKGKSIVLLPNNK